MKSKSTLTLIEQIIMVLVFAIATAICLRIFVYSSSLSAQGELKDAAVCEVRNAAEILKNTHGDVDAALDIADSENLGIELRIDPVGSESEYLGRAEVYALFEGSELYRIEVCWQEVSG